MPTLKYVGNAGRYRLTNSDVDVAQGETVTVDEETATHLQANGEFDVVDDSDVTDSGADEGDAAGETEGYLRDEQPDVQIEEGVCPWCPPDDRYEGDAVGQHAATAHPEAWDDYKED